MKRLIMLMAVIAMLSTACNRTHQKEDVVADTPIAAADSTHALTNTANNPGEHILKTATIVAQVQQFNRYDRHLHNSLKPYGAYIVNEEQTTSSQRIETNMTIKVPVDLFDDLLNALQTDSITLLQKTINANDVTLELYQQKAQAAAQKLAKEDYAALLAKARKTTDALEVEQALSNTQQSIASAVSRIAFLEQQSVYSTVTIRYYQDILPVEPSQSFWANLQHALGKGLWFTGNIMIALAYLWPLWLGGLAAWLVGKKVKATRRRTA